MSSPATIDGTPVAGATPFLVLPWSEVRDTLVAKRTLLGWSQAYLASQCPDPDGGAPMHHNTVYKFEKHGWRGPQDLAVVTRLCAALGLEICIAVREVRGAREAVVPGAPVDGGKRAKVSAALGHAAALLESAQPRAVAAERAAVQDPDLEF